MVARAEIARRSLRQSGRPGAVHAHVLLAAALACGIVAFSYTPLGICLRVLASLLTATQVAGSGSFLRSQTHGLTVAQRGGSDGPVAAGRRIPILDDLRVCVTVSTCVSPRARTADPVQGGR